MSVLGMLALLFVAIPIVELYLLIQVGQAVGVLPTLGLVLLTGVSGAYLARAEGLRVFRDVQSELAAGRMPGQALQDGLAVLVGGAFLLTPGIVTDLVGFSLLLPPTRRWILGWFRRRLERGIREGTIRTMVSTSGGVWAAGFRSGPGRPVSGSGASTPGVSGSDHSGPGRPVRSDGLDPSGEIEVPPPTPGSSRSDMDGGHRGP